MKTFFFPSITFLLFFQVAGLSQDTITSRIDSIICTDFVEEFYFSVPYDTAAYKFEWFLLEDSISFSQNDSVLVLEADSLILKSVSIPSGDTVLIDTFYLALRFLPIYSFDVPDLACFNGDSLTIIDQTILDPNYTSVSYAIDSGVPFQKDSDTITIFVGNGDSLIVEANYNIPSCNVSFDTSFQLKTLFSPQINIMSNEVCFGDSTILVNESIFDETIADFNLIIEGLDTFNISQDSFVTFLPQNIDIRNVIVSISQGTCSSTDTIQIRNKLAPSGMVVPEQACENENLVLDNDSQGTFANSSYIFEINSSSFNFTNSNTFSISDTFPNGTYQVQGIVNNFNSCIDTFSFFVQIDSVTYVSFQNLEDSYCENQDISILSANIDEGIYSGDYITNLGQGSALFEPDNADAEVLVTFTYMNGLGCVDLYSEVVDTVFPKPNLMLSGLDPTYCEFDPPSQLFLNQTIAQNSTFEITKDNSLFDAITALDYVFDPEIPGTYNIVNIYTDINGCYDTLFSQTIVHPLPIVSLDNDVVIKPGDVVVLGNTSSVEPNVTYIWSNNSSEPTIEVDDPGIYVLYAFNMATGCESNDTIQIAFDPLLETDLVDIVISPNPVQNIVTLDISKFVQGITVFDVFGNQMTLQGVNTFSTNQTGILELDFSIQNSGYYYVIIPGVGNFLLIKI